MGRTSFAGALVAMAVGAVAAFAIHSSLTDFDLRTAGVLLMFGGAADLLIRSMVGNSPLLSEQSAQVAAVVEPLGDPVLDASGNPIAMRNPPAQVRAPLIAPLPGTMPPGADVDTIVVADDPYGTYNVTHISSSGSVGTATGEPGYAAYESAVRAASGDPFDTPQSPVTVTTLGGRPVRPRGRGLGIGRRRRSSRG